MRHPDQHPVTQQRHLCPETLQLARACPIAVRLVAHRDDRSIGDDLRGLVHRLEVQLPALVVQAVVHTELLHLLVHLHNLGAVYHRRVGQEIRPRGVVAGERLVPDVAFLLRTERPQQTVIWQYLVKLITLQRLAEGDELITSQIDIHVPVEKRGVVARVPHNPPRIARPIAARGQVRLECELLPDRALQVQARLTHHAARIPALVLIRRCRAVHQIPLEREPVLAAYLQPLEKLPAPESVLD